MREEKARREDGGRPEEPPGLQFLRAPERWEGGAGKLVGFGGEVALFRVCRGGGEGVSRGEGVEQRGAAWSRGRRERGAREQGPCARRATVRTPA